MSSTKGHNNNHGVEIAIIGAGISGICMAIQLKKQLGVTSFTIYEKTGRLGGTWRDNIYPGAACDVPSHFYSYSFELNPYWSKKWSPQPEILAYIEGVSRKHSLDAHYRFHCEIVSAVWEEPRLQWRIEYRSTVHGESPTVHVAYADFLISGVGQLSQPAYPRFDGMDSFAGKMFHSARWDTSCDLSGKDVAIIGTGATAAQIIPEIVPKVRSLKIYQRTPNWVIPRGSVTAYPELVKWIFANVPFVLQLYRRYLFFLFDKNILAFTHGSLVNRYLEKECRKHLERQVKDPVLRAKLLPDYPIGCKRLLFMDELYPALTAPNAEIITEPINKLTMDSIETKTTSRKVDCIILATGFKTQAFLSPVELIGRNGVKLSERWHNGAEAYHGITVSGFPNFFMLYGPNTNLGHHSIIFMIECQVDYILQIIGAWIDHRRKSGSETERLAFDVKSDAQRRYNAKLQEELKSTVWSHGCKSWYVNEAGMVRNNWSGSVSNYWLHVRHPKYQDYDIWDPTGKIPDARQIPVRSSSSLLFFVSVLFLVVAVFLMMS